MVRNLLKIYLQPAFFICVVVLGLTAGGKSIAIRSFGVYLKKEPLDLKKSLEKLDENGLAPYKVVSKKKIENEEIIKSLGTRDYIQWVLEDTEADEKSPVRQCMLFITYYNHPDIVLHVPEECYMGGGYQRLASEDVEFVLNQRGEQKDAEVSVPGKYIVFSASESRSWKQSEKFSVLYLFSVNGVYAAGRDETRLILNKNLFGKHSYFCKVEWNFFNTSALGTCPDKAEAVEASRKLLGVILPVLEDQHWPDVGY